MRSTRAVSNRRRVIVLVIIAVVVVVAGAVAWIGIRGLLARQELAAIPPIVARIETSVASGDVGAARTAAKQLEQHAHRAASLTSDPVWVTAEILPGVGPNLTAVRQLAAAAETVSTRVVSPLVTASASIDLEKFRPVDGRLDTAPLVKAGPPVFRAQTALRGARASVAAISTSATIGTVRDAVDTMGMALSNADTTVTALANSARVLPGMLGEDGPRNILLLAQNPAELRATGGIIGSLTLIHSDHGAISIVKQASTADFRPLASPVITLPPETEGLYGPVVGRYVQDVGATPYFPLTAQMAAKMWTANYGGHVDGVIAIDPVTISYILKATGPVTVKDGRQISSENVVRVLLSESYRDYSAPADQDAFFASTASAVFSKVASGSADAAQLVHALVRAGSEHRVLLWSNHPTERAVFSSTTLSGGYPISNAGVAGIGVYFNDATGGKMDYYLTSAISVASAVCRADGVPTSRVTVTLKNTAPANAGTSLPSYVTGAGAFGVSPGTISTRVAVYGPKNGLLTATSSEGADYPTRSGTDSSRPVSLFTVDLPPGASKTVDVDFLDSEQVLPNAVVIATPSLGGTVAQNVALACH